MDHSILKAAIEAQFLMGHTFAHASVDADGETITGFTWLENWVRQQLCVPLNDLWHERVLELEMQGLASFHVDGAHVDGAPVRHHRDGTPYEVPGWRDEPREKWGTVGIHARGVLKLADLYGRPYVRYGESPALSAHWDLVWKALAQLLEPHDEEQWKREYPEQARARDEEQWQSYQRLCDRNDDGRG